MNEELIDYLKAYQEWRRGADTEQPDPTELGEKLDIAIELLGISKLRESRESHPLTSKEEAEKQVAEFDKVQPINKGSSERIIHKGGENHADCHLNSTTEEWEEVYDIIDTIVEERDRYKKALKDLREWAKQEEHIWSLGKEMDCFVATHYHAMVEKINEVLKETYKIEIGGETIDFPKD